MLLGYTLMEQMLAHFAGRVNNLSLWHNCQICVNKLLGFVIETTDFVYFRPVISFLVSYATPKILSFTITVGL